MSSSYIFKHTVVILYSIISGLSLSVCQSIVSRADKYQREIVNQPGTKMVKDRDQKVNTDCK